MPILAALALTLAADAPPVAKPTFIAPPVPTLTLPQQTALDCGVAFGLVGGEQQAKRPGADSFPVMGERHRAFFVRLGAQLMDAYGIGRAQIIALAQASAKRQLADPAAMRAAMPACLALLDASGG